MPAIPLLFTCSEDDFFKAIDPEPIEATVKTAVPLAYATTAVMAAVGGQAPPTVQALTPCTQFPCVALFLVSPDAPSLPFKLGIQGDILVAGFWASATQAVLSISFVDAPAGSQGFAVSTIATVPVIITGNEIRVVYADIDVDIVQGPIQSVQLSGEEVQSELDRLDVETPTETTVALGMDAWVITTDTGGTLDDLTDDSYTIAGGAQFIGASSSPAGTSGSVLQLALVQTRLTAAGCALNPTEGLAVIQEIGGSSGGLSEIVTLAVATILFHPECDGAADVVLATGNYLTSIGQPIGLEIGTP